MTFTALACHVFTESSITTGTVIKATHITELRTAISDLRARYALTAYAWTDPTLTARTTHFRAQHLLELRTALVEYSAAGL